MAKWERISPLDIVGQGERRCSMVVVLKCMVSINREMREGGGRRGRGNAEKRRTGAGQRRQTIPFC